MRATLPIDDKWLAAIATGSLLAAGSLPKQRPDWDSLPRANKTWAAWKTTFCMHQLTLEREQRATGERGDVFSSASAATALHGITDATARPGTHTSPDTLTFHAASGLSSSPASDLALQALDSHLDRIADAATNRGLMLSQLTDTNTRLDSATSTQDQAIKKLLTEIKISSSPKGVALQERGGAGVLVADSPAVGGAEATNDPAIFYRRLKKSYGLLILGGADAGAGA